MFIYDPNLFENSDPYDDFINYLLDIGFEEIDSGSFRMALGRGKVVIKVPTSDEGLIDNMVEARGWKVYKSRATRHHHIRLAPCRLLTNGCLMMMKVDSVDHSKTLPLWVSRVEGEQVGLYKGRVVAYDYALDLVERFGWEKEWRTCSQLFHSDEWESRRPHIHRFKQRSRKELDQTG